MGEYSALNQDEPIIGSYAEWERQVSPWQALRSGIGMALRYWQALLWMLAGTLFTGVILAILPALNLLDLAHQTVIARLADGVDTWQIVDLISLVNTSQRMGTALPPDLQGGALSLALMVLLLPLLGGIMSALLYGGVLLTYHETPAPFQARRFWWGCWHWFGTFLLLALIQSLLLLLTVIPLVFLSGWLLAGIGPVGSVIVAGLVALALLIWLMLFELSRVHAVAANTRSPFRGMSLAIETLANFTGPLLVFYLLSILVWAAVHAFFRLGVLPLVPLGALPLALLAQQVFILARLFITALRLAGLSVAIH